MASRTSSPVRMSVAPIGERGMAHGDFNKGSPHRFLWRRPHSALEWSCLRLPEADEATWRRRSSKRAFAVTAVKQTAENRALTPDASERIVSKRQMGRSNATLENLASRMGCVRCWSRWISRRPRGESAYCSSRCVTDPEHSHSRGRHRQGQPSRAVADPEASGRRIAYDVMT